MINLLYSEDFLNDSRTPGLILDINNVVLVNYYKPVSSFIELISSSYIEGDRNRVSIKNVRSIKNDSNNIQISVVSDIDVVDKCLLYFYYSNGEDEKLGGVIFNSENPGNILKVMGGINNLINIPLKEKILASIYIEETDLDLNFLEGNGFREGISAFSQKEGEEPITVDSYDRLVDINNFHNSIEKNIESDKFQIGYWNSLDKLGKFNPRYYINNVYSDLTTYVLYENGSLGENGGKSITTDKLSGKLFLLGRLTLRSSKIYEYEKTSSTTQKEVSLKEIPLRISVNSNDQDLQLLFNQSTGVLEYKSDKEGVFKVTIELTYTNLETSEITTLKSEINLTIGNSSTEWEIIESTPLSYIENGKRLYVFSNPEVGDNIKFIIKTVRTLTNKGEVEYEDGFNTWFEVNTEKSGDNEIIVTITIKKKNDNSNLWAPIVNNESKLIPCSIKFLETEIETFYCIQEPLMDSIELCDVGEDGNLKKVEENSIIVTRNTNYPIYPINQGEDSNSYWFIHSNQSLENFYAFPNKGVLNSKDIISKKPENKYYRTNIVGNFNSEVIFYKIENGEIDISSIIDDWRSTINIPKKRLSIEVRSEIGNKILEVSTESIEVDRYGVYQFNITSTDEFSIEIKKKTENTGYYVKFINPENNKIIEDDNLVDNDPCENKEFFVVVNPISENTEDVGFCELIISSGDLSKTIIITNHSYIYSSFYEIYSEPTSLSFPNEYLISGDYSGIGTLLLTSESKKIYYNTNKKLRVVNEVGDDIVEVSDIIDIFDCSRLNINRGFVRSEISFKLKKESETTIYPAKDLGSGRRVIIYPNSTEMYPDDIRYTIAAKKNSPNIYCKDPIKTIYLTEVGDKVKIKVYSNYQLTKEDVNYPINIIESDIKQEDDSTYTIELTLVKSVEKNSELGKLIIKKLITPNNFYQGYQVNESIINRILSDQNYIELNIKSMGKGSNCNVTGNFSDLSYFGESRVFYINFEDGFYNKNLEISTSATNYSTVRSDINSRKINFSVYSRLLGYNKPYQVDSGSYVQLSKPRDVGFSLNIFNKSNPGNILYNKNVSIPQERLLYGLLLGHNNDNEKLLFFGEDYSINNFTLHVDPDQDQLNLCIGNFPTSSKILEDTTGYINNLLLFESDSKLVTPIVSENDRININSKNTTVFFPKNNLLEAVVTNISLSDSYGNKVLLNLIQDPVEPVYKTTVNNESTIRFDYTGVSTYINKEGEILKICDPEVETNIPIDQLEVRSATLINPKLEFTKIKNTNDNTSVYELTIKVDPFISKEHQPLIGTIEILYKGNVMWKCIGVQECININFTTKLGVTYSGNTIGTSDSPIHTPAENSGTLLAERQYFKMSSSIWKITLSPDGSYESSEETVTDYLKITGYNWVLGEEFSDTFLTRETRILYSDSDIPSGFPILENIYSTNENFIGKEVPYVVEVYLAMLSTNNSDEGNYLPKITMYLQKDKKTVTSKVRKKK